MIGPAGTGKSTIAAQFVASAASRGKRAAMFCFDETITDLLKRTGSMSIPFAEQIEAGRVHLQSIIPTDTIVMLHFYEWAGEVKQAISVLKNRTGNHERLIRELSFGPQGMCVGAPLTKMQEILSGVPNHLGKIYAETTKSMVSDPLAERVLVLAPTGRDSRLMAEQIAKNGLLGEECVDLPALLPGISKGAGTVIVALEALTQSGIVESLGVLGHDLRSPLGAIRLSAENILRCSHDERTSRVAGRIQLSADRMARMLEQLLDFARVRQGSGIVFHLKPTHFGDI